jgi:hypothetical protein
MRERCQRLIDVKGDLTFDEVGGPEMTVPGRPQPTVGAAG